MTGSPLHRRALLAGGGAAVLAAAGFRTAAHAAPAAMNELGYVAAAVGNHEFDYGIPLLRAFEKQLDIPLLAANAIDSATGEPAFRPYVVKTVRLTGAQLKDYLERSAGYYKAVTTPGPHLPDALTNAGGTPDYLYDVAAGLDAPLTYDIDLARPVGLRITGLAHDGVPVTAEQAFAVAVNNYRQSGGGDFPHIATAPVLHNRQLEIRQLIIDWVRERGEIDPAAFHRADWRLVVDGVPVVVG